MSAAPDAPPALPAPQACVAYRAERSAGGHPLPVLKSALQKYIRRGEQEKALQTVREFHTFATAAPNVVPQTEAAGAEAAQVAKRLKSIRTNYLHRLMVIVLEDVGDTALVAALHSWFVALEPLEFGAPRAKQIEIHLVRAACVAAKSRACSHAKAVATLPCLLRRPAPCPERDDLAARYPVLWQAVEAFGAQEAKFSSCPAAWVPEFLTAVKAGRELDALFWGWKIATAEVTRATLQARSPPASPYARKAKPIWVLVEALWTLCTPELRQLLNYLPWLEGLEKGGEKHFCWILPTLVLVGAAPPFPGLPPWREAEISRPFTPDELVRLRTAPLEVRPYVLDQHTGARPADAGSRFAREGGAVAPEAPPGRAVWRDVYETRKAHQDTAAARAAAAAVARVAPSETAAYRYIARAQLVTSASKTDTHFAHRRGGEAPLQVVKGPFVNEVAPQQALRINRLKARLGLPHVPDLRIEYLVPDYVPLYPETLRPTPPKVTPLGLRNALAGSTTVAPFLVGASWIPEAILHVGFHQSQVWPPTLVVSAAANSPPLAQYRFCSGSALACAPLWAQYVRLLALRHVAGIGDHADRNFLVLPGDGAPRLVCVDDEPSQDPPRFGSGWGDKKNGLIRLAMRTPDFVEFLRALDVALPELEDPGAAARLQELQSIAAGSARR